VHLSSLAARGMRGVEVPLAGDVGWKGKESRTTVALKEKGRKKEKGKDLPCGQSKGGGGIRKHLGQGLAKRTVPLPTTRPRRQGRCSSKNNRRGGGQKTGG